MTKHVVNSAEVYHLWAHQAQDSARNGSSSVSFRGVDLYSYGLRIGTIATNSEGARAYIITDSANAYSSTTSNHCYAALRSVPLDATWFLVPSVQNTPERNLSMRRAEVLEKLGKAKRAWKYAHSYYTEANRVMEDMERYAAFFSVPMPTDIPDFQELWGKAQAKFRDRVNNVHKYEAEAAERRAKNDAEASRLALESLEEWKRGEPVFVSAWKSYLIYQYMRIEGSEVVTTMGARVPASHVKRAMRLVLPMIDKVTQGTENWYPKSPIRLGHYTLNRIDWSGVVTVGCHHFEAEEIRRIAALLNTYDAIDALEAVPDDENEVGVQTPS